ncbi:N-acetylglucosamine-6-phosphate deacetylase [Alsobacter sp. SYSU M60028]|uniref:N-acetylglucosamine-6-phosphate deacetylase n=1 Tax=Alsobacter ponti TaxID=2962936 RepID=A0ABT1L7B9_9HYPH|nr:N-acetylglucosamine-6-phosphate deacetylase [Alsobacter ponti]MCP8936971.1 N-acetylglucosamine-6-phosphate deacetylase [Alsobacter ponti]
MPRPRHASPAAAGFLILCPRLFDGEAMREDACVWVRDGRIAAVMPRSSAQDGLPHVRLPDGALLAPGFIDTQVNGGGGVMFNDAPTPEGAAAIVAAHRRHGTTGLLPTLITDAPEAMDRALDAGPAILAQPGVLGLHLEGPFINPARKGVHRADYIVPLDAATIARLRRAAALGRSFVTLAPELAPPGVVAALTGAGLRVSAGHTEATGADMERAAGEGLTGVTHLFNAMSQLQGRAPGVVGAAMADERLFVGIIADGLHVDPLSLRAAFRAIGAERLMLVTDAMSSVGAATDRFMLMGREVRLAGGRLTTADGTLAGAHLTMAEAVRNAVAMMGASLPEALRMASRTPAEFLGLGGERGRVAPGMRADLVALGPDLDVLDSWVDGEGTGALG